MAPNRSRRRRLRPPAAGAVAGPVEPGPGAIAPGLSAFKPVVPEPLVADTIAQR